MIYGNKEGIRDSLLAKLETLYDIEIPAEVCRPEQPRSNAHDSYRRHIRPEMPPVCRLRDRLSPQQPPSRQTAWHVAN